MAKHLTNLTFEQWLTLVFDHPVTKPEWYWDIESDWWEGASLDTVRFLTQAFENAGTAFQPYSDAQVNQGLWYIASNACSNHMLALLDVNVSWIERERCIHFMHALDEQCFTVDCDVLQADGGTRTASITGAYVATVIALRKMIANKTASPRALKTQVVAVSVGIVGGEEMLDLCYEEDSRAEVDFNVVMTGEGKFIEVQGTAEGEPFTRDAMNRLIDLARDGITELFKIQKALL